MRAPTTLPETPARLLRVDVLRTLREDILSCRLAPGSELTEAELAERFAVSKSPVRDALSRLVHEGLVTVVPRQGYRVAPISVKDARDMFEYRAILEGNAARIAAESASDEALRTLDRFRTFDLAAFPEGFIPYNRQFHHAVAALCGNARLAQAAASQIDQMDRVITVSVDAVRNRDTAKLAGEHAEIIDALQRRDARRASTLLARHVLDARKRVCDALARAAVVE